MFPDPEPIRVFEEEKKQMEEEEESDELRNARESEDE